MTEVGASVAIDFENGQAAVATAFVARAMSVLCGTAAGWLFTHPAYGAAASTLNSISEGFVSIGGDAVPPPAVRFSTSPLSAAIQPVHSSLLPAPGRSGARLTSGLLLSVPRVARLHISSRLP